MKKLILATAVLALGSMIPGCATPAYTGGMPTIQFPPQKQTGEVSNQMIRNMSIEYQQMAEDINHILLLDPVGKMSRWHIR